MGKHQRILVTGGAGFIGSHVAEALLRHGYEVTVFDNFSTGRREDVPQEADVIKGDIGCVGDLQAALRGHDAVIHMAGKIIVPESVHDPMGYFHTNVVGSMLLLDTMRTEGVSKIIFSSSAAVYGNPERVPIVEEDGKHPTSPYGATKLAFEDMLSSYAQSYGMHCTSLRYFNAYGPREHHNPETHAIPLFTQAMLHGKPLRITGSQDQVRDFVYITDIAEAHVLALSLEGLHQLNLGSGTGVSLRELVKTIADVTTIKPTIEQAPPRPGDPEKLIAATGAIEKLLGWTPKVSLEEGLERTFAYFSSLVTAQA